jgi:pimeloyl-ACP methyl ester carboxylesterase
MVKRLMIILLISLLALIMILLVVLRIYSPGKPEPFLDGKGNALEGSISEKIYLDINGVKQGMFIKGKDASKPVLLYLHGGMPDYFLSKKYPTGFEDHFVVVWWEQRGVGMSYRPDDIKENISLNQIVSDIVVLSNYLKLRFGKEKIYLMGHSGGTFPGMMAVAQAPELFSAYIGIAQMSNQLQSEILAYNYMLDTFSKIGNKKMVEKLKAAPVNKSTGTSKNYLAIRDEGMHTLGIGTMRNMHSIVSGIFLPSLLFKEYSLNEKFRLWRGKAQSGASIIWAEMLSTDLGKAVPEVNVPIYFMHGIYDYTCSYTEAKKYFDALNAPIKGFYTFNNSAHSPMFEEPEKAERILRENVLYGSVSLADKN